MNKVYLYIMIATILLVAPQAYSSGNKDFSARDLYPDVPTIEIKDFASRFNDVIIVDVRSRYEYKTLRIKGALHIPVSKLRFDDDIKNLRSETGKPIVFYCNGRPGYKSYKAVKRSKLAGIKNIYAFDAGIFDWARAYPDRAVLMGQNPVDTSKLISDEEYEARLLDPAVFVARIGPATLVLDIRSRFQRAAAGLFPFEEKWVQLGDKKRLDQYIAQARRENRTLLIYDEVGKQTLWLMYYLKKMKVKNYYFLRGGAEGYYEMLKKLDF